MSWTPERLYSKNFEDLYLWRLFRNKDIGFFVDVGACDPVIDSVTKIFYDNGWNGINIEPAPQSLRRFINERPRDINLSVAISDEAGKVLIDINGDGSTSSPATSSRLPASYKLQADCSSIEVCASSLFDILASCSPREIDFLKINVEGLELQAIRGLSLEKLPERIWPNVILISATISALTLAAPSREEVNHLLKNWGYCRFYFDGLNDYYCQSSEFELYKSLALPPNVFDEILYTPRRFEKLIDDNNRLRERLSEADLGFQELSNSLSRQLDDQAAENRLLQTALHDLRIDVTIKREQIRDLRSEVLRTASKLNWYRRQAKLFRGLLKSAYGCLQRLNVVVSMLLSGI